MLIIFAAIVEYRYRPRVFLFVVDITASSQLTWVGLWPVAKMDACSVAGRIHCAAFVGFRSPGVSQACVPRPQLAGLDLFIMFHFSQKKLHPDTDDMHGMGGMLYRKSGRVALPGLQNNPCQHVLQGMLRRRREWGYTRDVTVNCPPPLVTHTHT